MGKVFSEQEITQGRVPELGDFPIALKNFKEAVNEGLEAGLLDGAVVFGSVAIGAFSLRSDFDAMIVPVDHSRAAMGAVKDVRARLADYAFDVPFEPITHDRRTLENGEHEIDRFFGAHLTGPFRTVLGNDPKEYMRFADKSARDIILDYIRRKKKGIQVLAGSPGTQKDYEGYQRLLELPVAIGRKTLMALDEVERTDRSVVESANKTAVARHALELFDELDLKAMAQIILAQDRFYKDELAEALESRDPHQGYAHFLQELDELAMEVVPWLDELDRALQVRLPE